MVEKFFYKKTLVGIKMSKVPQGSVPATDGKEPLQLVTLKHPKGAYLKAHAHKPRRRTTMRLQECLIPIKGETKIDLYGPDNTYFDSCTLKVGQLFILMDGGYGIHITEDAELIEVKNGPFVEDKILI